MDRRDYFFLQLLSESELDDGFEQAEQADRALTIDAGLIGIQQGLSVAERSGTPDLNVETATGQSYNPAGERMSVPSLQVVDMSVDNLSVSTDVAGGGNEKIVSLFLKFERALSDPRIDGNSSTVFFERNESFSFFVVQGSEGAPPPTPPALEADKILLADVRRSFGQTQIFNADITPPGGTYTAIANRRQAAFKLSAGALSVLTGTPEESDQAILTELNNHVTGVSNLHPMSSIDYAGGAAWLDGTTNPATDGETQLDKFITDLIDTTAPNSGGEKLGLGARAAWLGGRTNPGGIDIHAGIDKVITDLLAETAGDDGAERIGAEARTSGASGTDLLAGSVASQLQEIINDTGSLSNANTWIDAQTITGVTEPQLVIAPSASQDMVIDLVQNTAGDDAFLKARGADVFLWLRATNAAETGPRPIRIAPADDELAFFEWTMTSVTSAELSMIAGGANNRDFTISMAIRAAGPPEASTTLILEGQPGIPQTGGPVDNDDGGDVRVVLGPRGSNGNADTGEPGSMAYHYRHNNHGISDQLTRGRVDVRVRDIAAATTVNDFWESEEGALADSNGLFAEVVVIGQDRPAVNGANNQHIEKQIMTWHRESGGTGVFSANVSLGNTGNTNLQMATITAAINGSGVPSIDITSPAGEAVTCTIVITSWTTQVAA